MLDVSLSLQNIKDSFRMDHSAFDKILASVNTGDCRALARFLSLIENGEATTKDLVKAFYKQTKQALIVGVTGPPGAGKSTLVDGLACEFLKSGKRVAIVAVDPSSPFSGGAVLGDRIRMDQAFGNQGVYIRSMATRGALGGLAPSSIDVVNVLAGCGFDLVLLETVGVGQAEIDVVKLAQTCIVVLVPGLGDSVQALKAGVLEIADIFALNKADRAGADLLHRDVKNMLALKEISPESWEVPIVSTVATENKGLTDLAEQILKHQVWMSGSAALTKRELLIRETILKLAENLVFSKIKGRLGDELTHSIQACLTRKSDPHTEAEALVKKLT